MTICGSGFIIWGQEQLFFRAVEFLRPGSCRIAQGAFQLSGFSYPWKRWLHLLNGWDLVSLCTAPPPSLGPGFSICGVRTALAYSLRVSVHIQARQERLAMPLGPWTCVPSRQGLLLSPRRRRRLQNINCPSSVPGQPEVRPQV